MISISSFILSFIIFLEFGPPFSLGKTTTKCSPGFYANISRTIDCVRCKGGFYGAFGSLCDGEQNCFGDVLEYCTGPCNEGYFCPPGSTSPIQQPCGSPEFYCPKGSERRTKVQSGFYSIPTTEPYEIVSKLHEVNRVVTHEMRISEMHRSGEKECEPGFFCERGRKFACSAFGSYGISKGLMSRTCNGKCPIGFYCTPSTERPIKCPAGSFGNRTGETSPTCAGLCSPGFYCEEGSTRPDENECPGGLAGTDSGSTNANCSKVCNLQGICRPNICEPGYYCPPGSITTKQHECGEVNFYCPKGSASPKIVSTGYYTIGWKSVPKQHQKVEDAKVRFEQIICETGTYCQNGIRYLCPAGRYSNETGATSCLKNYCEEGYYCPEGSTSQRQNPCGSPDLFCPIGSGIPLKVPIGYYSIGGTHMTRTGTALCEPGFYCVGDGIKRYCPAGTFGSSFGLSSSTCDGKAAAGYYTPKGSTSPTAFPCPPGRFGLEGMDDEFCTGPAEEGFYTDQASDNPRQHECGGDMVYCPEGSSKPIQVSVGYFSVGSSGLTRSSERPCESLTQGQSSWFSLPPKRPYSFHYWCPYSTRMNTSNHFF